MQLQRRVRCRGKSAWLGCTDCLARIYMSFAVRLKDRPRSSPGYLGLGQEGHCLLQPMGACSLLGFAPATYLQRPYEASCLVTLQPWKTAPHGIATPSKRHAMLPHAQPILLA